MILNILIHFVFDDFAFRVRRRDSYEKEKKITYQRGFWRSLSMNDTSLQISLEHSKDIYYKVMPKQKITLQWKWTNVVHCVRCRTAIDIRQIWDEAWLKWGKQHPRVNVYLGLPHVLFKMPLVCNCCCESSKSFFFFFFTDTWYYQLKKKKNREKKRETPGIVAIILKLVPYSTAWRRY